jgi:hypothetical protein
MPRTSLVARIIHAMGVHVGESERLLPPDIFNPTGYWEYAEAVQIDIDIFSDLRTSRRDVAGIDVGRLYWPSRSESWALFAISCPASVYRASSFPPRSDSNKSSMWTSTGAVHAEHEDWR